MSRTTIRNKALAAQGAGIALLGLLLAGGAFAVLVGAPTLEDGGEDLPEPPGPEAFDLRPVAGGGAGNGDELPFDPVGVAGALSEMPGAPRPARASSGGEDGGTATPPPARPARGEVEFVGSILAPNKRLAVLSFGGRQWWVAEGEERTLGDSEAEAHVKVHEVESGHVQLSIDGRSRRLARAERSGQRATVMVKRPAGAEPADPAQSPEEMRRMEQLREIRRRARERGETEGMEEESDSLRARQAELQSIRERQMRDVSVETPGTTPMRGRLSLPAGTTGAGNVSSGEGQTDR